jgi:hypothetical protein
MEADAWRWTVFDLTVLAFIAAMLWLIIVYGRG